MTDVSGQTASMVLSYNGLRRAVGISGLLLPVVLGPGGWLIGISFQENISSYYHTGMRDVFVGTMCAMAVFLFCYRGHDWVESWTANLGCLFALGVALCPLDADSDPLYQTSITGYLHTLSGGAFFLVLAFYSLYHFPRKVDDPDPLPPHGWERNFIYRTSGITILLSMIAMGTYLLMIPNQWKEWLNQYNFLFWMEWIAVWAFAAAWLTKGRTIIAEIAVEILAVPREAIAERISEVHRQTRWR